MSPQEGKQIGGDSSLQTPVEDRRLGLRLHRSWDQWLRGTLPSVALTSAPAQRLLNVPARVSLGALYSLG